MDFLRKNIRARMVVLASTAFALINFASAQNYPAYPPPPTFTPAQLDSLVSRIALYPDPLLAEILAASTFPDQIQAAAGYSFSHQNLQGQDLANAIWRDNLPWDAGVQALIPFPSVMDMMVKDMNWTRQLGDAVLAQRPDVMDAAQRMRQLSEQYGYLASNNQIRIVDAGPAIEILPADAGFVYVPVYNPLIVFAPPRPGFFAAGAIGFGNGFAVGASFGNFGWGGGFNWSAHTVVVNRAMRGRNVAVYARNNPPAVHLDRARVESHEISRKAERR